MEENEKLKLVRERNRKIFEANENICNIKLPDSLEFIDIDYADCNTDKLQEMAKKLETIF